MGIREGDIEALRNRRKDEGRPIKSDHVIKGDKRYYYRTNKRGNVRITDKT